MKPTKNKLNIYSLTFRLPIIIWQLIFFVGPVLFMVAMSFFLVKNYRMTEAFEFINWTKMFSKNYFWDSYWFTIIIAGTSTLLTMLIAFPASFTLAFKVSDNIRRWAIFMLIIPFFTSYLVRTFSWYVILAEKGVINALFSYLDLGPFKMLNTHIGTLVGYMTLTLPLVIILQTVTMANIDRNLIEAAYNLGCKPRSIIQRVIIPLSKTGFIIAAVFCFILSFGDFVAPFYLGGSQEPTLPILILDTTKSGQQWPRAAVVAIVMMITLFSIAFIGIMTAYSKSFKKFGLIILTRNIKETSEIANQISPEHLEIYTKNPKNYLKHIKNAGSIFLGAYSPEAIGDYLAGPNHVLPTTGTAKFSSGLSVFDFIKRQSIIKITKSGIERLGSSVINLAEYENLQGHANSVKIRIK